MVAPKAKAKPKAKTKAKEKGRQKSRRKSESICGYNPVAAYDTLVSEDPAVLAEHALAYFEECEEFCEAPTITGAALALNLTRESLINFDKSTDPEVLQVISYIKQRIEVVLERRLLGTSPSGALFNLKSSFGWKEIKHISLGGGEDGQGPITIDGALIDVSKLSTSTMKELVAARRASTEPDTE